MVNVSQRDAGEYRCLARNAAGTVISSRIALKVACKWLTGGGAAPYLKFLDRCCELGFGARMFFFCRLGAAFHWEDFVIFCCCFGVFWGGGYS